MSSLIDCGVFVTGLPLSVTEADIESYFQVVGDVEAVLCKIDKTSNKFDGEAFIIFHDTDSSSSAVQQLHDKFFEGSKLTVTDIESTQEDDCAILLGRFRLKSIQVASDNSKQEDLLINSLVAQLQKLNDQHLDKIFSKLAEKRDLGLFKPSSTVDKHLLFPPKLPHFSGDKIEKGKTDATYNQWKYQVCGLINDRVHSSAEIITAIRQSLKGTAFDILQSMGNSVSPSEVLEKFDHIFGNVFQYRQLLKHFQSTQKESSETIVSWGCRLQRFITQIREVNSSISDTEVQVEDLLRSQFYLSINDEKFTIALRHKYDAQEPFENLFTYAREVEYQFDQTSKHSHNTKKSVVSQQTKSSDTLVEKVDQIVDKLVSMEGRLSKIEQRGNFI